MKTIIYYFTGTGNSLWITRELAKKLGNTQLVPMTDTTDVSYQQSDCCGFIFPVCMWGVPARILRFIREHQFTSSYYFAIAVNGGQVSNTLVQLSNFLTTEKGIHLASAFSIKMPSNYIPMGGAEPQDIQKELFAAALKKCEHIAEHINNQSHLPVERGPLWQRLVLSLLYKLSFPKVHTLDKSFFADSKCNGCGICQSVCPCGNISLTNNKPVFTHRCEQCFACLQWCPQQALQYGKGTASKSRYHNPSVSTSDIIASRKV